MDNSYQDEDKFDTDKGDIYEGLTEDERNLKILQEKVRLIFKKYENDENMAMKMIRALPEYQKLRRWERFAGDGTGITIYDPVTGETRPFGKQEPRQQAPQK